MSMTDPVADMLTRIRNALTAKHETVEMPGSMPSSNLKVHIAEILKEEGFIVDFMVDGDAKKELTITLKYTEDGTRAITGLKRISKPGLRVNASSDKLPKVLNGLGIAIISTSQGLIAKLVKQKSVAKLSLMFGKRGDI